MNERVWLDDDGIIRLRSTPRQPREVVDENVDSVRELIERQKRAGRPVLLLIDVSRSEQVSLFARREYLVFFRMGVDRFALFGRLPRLTALVSCLANLACYRHARVFASEKSAIDFLLNPPPQGGKSVARKIESNND